MSEWVNEWDFPVPPWVLQSFAVLTDVQGDDFVHIHECPQLAVPRRALAFSVLLVSVRPGVLLP